MYFLRSLPGYNSKPLTASAGIIALAQSVYTGPTAHRMGCTITQDASLCRAHTLTFCTCNGLLERVSEGNTPSTRKKTTTTTKCNSGTIFFCTIFFCHRKQVFGNTRPNTHQLSYIPRMVWRAKRNTRRRCQPLIFLFSPPLASRPRRAAWQPSTISPICIARRSGDAQNGGYSK